MKYKKTSLLAIAVALALTLCMAAGFTTGAVAKDNESLPDGQTQTSQRSNEEAGPRANESTPSALLSVNRGDEHKFTPEKWAEILKEVEAGEVLFFETAEEERAFWDDEDNAALKESFRSKNDTDMTWEYLPITENILAGEVEANMMPEDGAEYQVKLVEANGVQYQWISVGGAS